MWVSYLFLLLFGIQTLAINRENRKLIIWGGLVIVFGLWAAMLFVIEKPTHYELINRMDLHTRHTFGFISSLLAGIALIARSAASKKYSKNGANHKAIAGLALILYSFFAGLVPSGVMFFDIFPVEAVRGLCAMLLTYSIIKALHVFDMEKYQILEKKLSNLAHSEKLASIGRLAAGIAHEINNPMANAMLNTEMLKNFMQGNECCKESIDRVEKIEKNLERASKIAAEMLYFSQAQTGETELLNLNEIFESALLLLGNKLKYYTLEKEYGEIQMIDGIPWKLEEVIINVMINAMDAMPNSGTIFIKTYENSKFVKAEIRDTGSGVPEEFLNNVFDPFFTTKEVGKGTGLGLSVSYGIMHMFGGDIKISNSKEDGAVVTLIFPKGGTDA
jgi:signal transduction histidine kinase